ncbi:hypothetical protein ACLMJK_004028 [Lecanora helva]
MHAPSNSRTSNRLPSPTLTNPDMILPDSSPSPASSSPTPRQDRRLPSPPPIESNVSAGPGLVFDEKRGLKHRINNPVQTGVLRHQDGRPRLRSSSERGSSRIAFENSRLSFRQDAEEPIASSPTIHEDNGQRIYTESTKDDFEDAEGTYTTPAILEEDENDPNSHAAMTRRAEAILASAKRRLTNMEGNLNRARSTLQSRPSSSMSSFENRSPEPVSLYTLPGKGRSPGGFSPLKHRQTNLPSLDEIHQGHSRVFSETSVPSSMQTSLPNGPSAGKSSEMSNGLGVNGEDAALRDRHSEPSRNWFWNGLTRDGNHRHANRPTNGLEALSEDGPLLTFEQREAREDIIEEETGAEAEPSDAAAAFNAQNPPSSGLTRARSTTQMNELREQMQDLKGKISTLKQRAREDNMRRRSLQSLRAPSPFTDAERWHTGTPSSEDMKRGQPSPGPVMHVDSPAILNSSPQATNPDSGRNSLTANQVVKENVNEGALGENQAAEISREDKEAIEQPSEDKFERVNGFPSQKQRLVIIDEPTAVEADDGVSNGSSSSMGDEVPEDSIYGDQDYHETSTSPVVERHEDRPDAFDYEHFILSSALGTYSGVGMRRSSSKKKKRAYSQSSESSVETTKPSNSTEVAGEVHYSNGTAYGGHGRQNSVDSVSTDNTFATANENADFDGDQDDWAFGQTTAGLRQVQRSESTRKHHGRNVSKSSPFLSNGVHSKRTEKHETPTPQNLPNGIKDHSASEANGVTLVPDLITLLSSTDAWQEGAPPTAMKLGDRDLELVERLVKSLAKVCSQVHTLEPENSVYESRVFRRKLDAARRVLDGEMNGEAF